MEVIDRRPDIESDEIKNLLGGEEEITLSA